MAQTIDLPETTQAAAPNASADDLLSQLAGAEIDKLLAEAEIEKPSMDVALPAPEAPTAELQTLTDVAAAAPEDSLLQSEHAPAAPPAAVSKQDHAEAAVSAELDELFKELSSDAVIATPTPVVEAPTAAPAPAPVPAASAPVPAKPAPATASPVRATPAGEQPTSTQERAALDAIAESEEADEPDAPAALPVYLKPLEWLNLPLSFVPEPARDLVGKVAIISFMNAVSVMVYLLVFHRR